MTASGIRAAQQGSGYRRSVALTAVALGVAFGLVLMEGMLRLLTALDYLPLSLGSETLLRYRLDWHHDRPPGREMFDRVRRPEGCTDPTTRVIVGGDSWMQSLVLFNSFVTAFDGAVRAAESNRCVEFINTATGSFSPSPINAKITEAITRFGAPNMVVIHIDETDVLDEWIRYKTSTITDKNGEILAIVPYLSEFHELVYYAALSALRQQPLYVLRFAEYLYIRYVLTARVRAVLAELGVLPSYDSILAIQREGNANGKYGQQIAWFKGRVGAMVRDLRRLAPDAIVLLSAHPHYLHLRPEQQGGYRFTVATILKEIVKESDFTKLQFVDAAQQMQRIHGAGGERVFRWPTDPFSHLVEEAEIRFGNWLGEIAGTRLSHGRARHEQ